MRHCYILRVFTRDGEGGNHLGVVTDCTGLPERAMQEIATDLGFSETIFVDWRHGSVPAVRIFTPTTEMPFAGHPLVGAAWVLGAMGPGTVDTMTCGIGEVYFEASSEGALVRVPLSKDVEPADAQAITGAGLPVFRRAWWAKMPLPYLVAEVASAQDVVDADPAEAAVSDIDALYVFADDGSSVKARFFAGGLGVAEDPATGSAAAAFAAVRSHEGEPVGERVVFQGDEIGHPSTIDVEWNGPSVTMKGGVTKDEVRVIER